MTVRRRAPTSPSESCRPLALAGAELEVLEPPLERLLPETAVAPALNVRNAPGASLRPDPVLHHAEALSDFVGG